MRAVLTLCAATAALLSFAACRTSRARPIEPDVPAVIVNPTSESRAALAQAVSAALNGTPVTLAEDALTDVSVLVLQRAPRRDPNGLPANGRDLGSPERFRLVKSGGKCVLVHEGSGKRFDLVPTDCIASG